MIHTVRLYKLFILHTCGLGVLFVLLTSELVFKSRYCSPYLSLPPPPTQCRHYRGQWKRQKKKKKLSFQCHGEVLACSVDVYDTQVYLSLVILFPSSWKVKVATLVRTGVGCQISPVTGGGSDSCECTSESQRPYIADTCVS